MCVCVVLENVANGCIPKHDECWPRRGVVFDGNEGKYDLWEVTFLSFMRIHYVFVPSEGEKELDEARDANSFAELVQFLDDRSLFLERQKMMAGKFT
jgi:hypothetical protein